jgi:hypothetical protein
MKIILQLHLILILVSNTITAKIVNDSVYQIPKTYIAPVIDGLQDGCWKPVDWNMQRIYNVGDPPTDSTKADSGAGLAGMSKTMWDNENLYIILYNR